MKLLRYKGQWYCEIAISRLATMDQTVYIPFNKRLEPGENSFTLEIPQSCFNKRLQFGTATLVPEVYNQQALELGIDPVNAGQDKPITDNFNLNLTFTGSLFGYQINDFVPLSTPEHTPQVLDYLNQYFEKVKPEGFALPPVIFDWVLAETYGMHPRDATRFYVNKCEEMYGERYVPRKHGGFLPEYIRLFDHNFNFFKYPTNPKVFSQIRIRQTIMYNVVCHYSNDHLLRFLGFHDAQLAYGNHERKFRFQNSDRDQREWTSFSPPSTEKFMANTKILVYPRFLHVKTKNYPLTTTRQNTKKPEALAADYNHSFDLAAFGSNVRLKLAFDATLNKFVLTFPSSIKAVLNVPSKIAYKLGYGHVSQITQEMINRKLPKQVKLQDANAVSQIQTFDTGLVLISLGQKGSLQTSHLTNALMAVLEPQSGGYHSTKPNLQYAQIVPWQFNSTFEFVLHVFNESNQLKPFDWRGGAYIRGILVSKL